MYIGKPYFLKLTASDFNCLIVDNEINIPCNNF